nr:hypothetical protein BaRGS_008026 [Batillaria attramentaria]
MPTGDNSTCRSISGIYTRQDLDRGANKIVTIPLGSTQVNVSQLRPSINFLGPTDRPINLMVDGADASKSDEYSESSDAVGHINAHSLSDNFGDNDEGEETYDDTTDAGSSPKQNQTEEEKFDEISVDDFQQQKDVTEDGKQEHNVTEDTQTSEPDHLLRPQSDSPTYGPFNQRTRSGDATSYRRFRRPTYSQSFTFRRRYQQMIAAQNRGGATRDDSGSGREMMRRQQEYAQQRKAQNDEYERRLEEHKRRLRERQMQIERQQQQQQQHRRRHHNHHRQRQHQGRQSHQQRFHQGRRPVTAPVAPSGGIVSRIDTSVSRQETGNRGVPSQRVSERQETGAPARESSTARPERQDLIQRIQRQRIQQQQQLKRQQQQQEEDLNVDISGNEDDTTTMQATQASTTTNAASTTRQGRDYRRFTPTPAPTRDFLTIPRQPVGPTSVSVIPNTGTVNIGPQAPQFIPVDSRFGGRSSFTSALSNRLEDSYDTEQEVGVDVNLIPNVIESRPVIGGSDVTSNQVDIGSSYEWRVSGLTECTLTCGAGCVCRGTLARQQAAEYGNMQTGSRCPARCGAGTKTRHVACLGEEGDKLPDSRCDKFSRPTPDQTCRAEIPCGGDWFASEWEQLH